MTIRAPLLPAVLLGLSVVLGAQPEEFARLLRKGEQATLTAFGSRPVDLAAQKLVEEFGLAVNVEDPVDRHGDDVLDITAVASKKRLLIPRSVMLETRFDLRADGALRDPAGALRDLADAANLQLPFNYRLDRDAESFTLVATQTRDDQARAIAATPILDRRVTIPPGTRRIFQHVDLLTRALEAQTGVRLSCCQAAVAGIPWGSTSIFFEARDEQARHALLRLLRAEPGRDRLVKNESGSYDLVKSRPDREHWYWLMRCQPGAAWCFINVAAIPEKP